MANSEKDIVITPNIGSSSDDPKIEFKGASATANAQVITARIYPTANGTLSFEGNAGQLFSITNTLTGTLFSVNDISGIPSIEVIDDGTVRLAQYTGNVGIGIANATSKLHVVGSANITGNIDAGNINATIGSAYLPNSGVTANTYGNARIVPVITVDAKGRITSASNVTMLPDVANIVLTGDVTGSANAILTPGTTSISISTTIQPNSVALGTDTTGNYTDRVIPGGAITVSGTADEGNVITVAHADTSAVSNVASDNSNGTVIQDVSFGFDTYGHVTSASVATTDLDTRYLRLASTSQQLVSGNVLFEGNVTFLGNVVTVSANNLVIQDNFIYLNDGNIANNIDFGFVGNYNDGTYRHAGFFRDATDGYWKVFDNYLPEPDAAIDIDTGNTSYREANFKANVAQLNRVSIGAIDNNSLIATGNVGIGISSPTANLHVRNTAIFDTQGTGGSLSIYSYSALVGQLRTPYDGAYDLLSINSVGNVIIAQNNNEKFRFTSDARLGIGTSTPTSSLHVVGTANITGNVTAGNINANIISTFLPNSGVTAATYGNATIVPVITIDAKGRITSASNVNISPIGTSTNQQILYNNAGNVAGSSGLTYDGSAIKVNGNLESIYQSGDEGGEIFLKNAITNTSITNGVTIDVYQNKVRIFESGGTNRGGYWDITSLASGASTNLLGTGGTTDYTALSNKPSLNVTFTGDVTGSGNVNLSSSATNSLSIALTVQPNSVALGTDTTGNYTDRVVGGTGISVTGTADEGNVITVGLTNTAVTPNTYGNATIVPVITVDAQGRITSASNVTISFPASSGGGSNVFTYAGGANGNTITQTNSVPASINTTAFNFFAGQCAGSSITTGCNNIFLGERAGFCNTTGSYNFFAGKCAGGCTTTGDRNIFIGNSAGFCNTTGNNNTFIGAAVGYCNTTGVRNTAVGGAAGQYNTTGNDNTSLGYFAGCCNTSGSRNIFLGRSSGANVTTGNDNIIFGCLTSCAGFTQATSNVIVFATGGIQRFEIDSSLRNILIGTCAGNAITSGIDNIFAGQCAGLCNTTGRYNNFFGSCAGLSNTTGQSNNFFGCSAGLCNTTGNHNNFFGNFAGRGNTTGIHNTFIGHLAGCSNTIGTNNTFIGQCAGRNNTSGVNNTFIGNYAGRQNSFGNQNTFFGAFAGCSNTTGNNNTFIGQCAGFCNTFGSYNNFFGNSAGLCNISGNHNNFFGQCAGYCNSTGNSNTFIGNYAGRNNTFGSHNNFFGFNAGIQNTTGGCNNFIGQRAGYCNTTGGCNNFIGQCAGASNTSGSNNIFTGTCAGCRNTTGCRNIYLGINSGANITTGNDNIIFGNVTPTVGFTAETSNVIILATGGNRRIDLASTANLFVGTNANVVVTSSNLSINGAVVGPMTRATAQATTSGVLIDFTGIPSWVKRITGMLSNVSTNGTSLVIFQLGDSGGVETTGYKSGASFGAPGGAFATSTTGFLLDPTNLGVASYARHGIITIVNISGNEWVYASNMYSEGGQVVGSGAGSKTLSATLDRVRLTTTNGTDAFDSGNVNIIFE